MAMDRSGITPEQLAEMRISDLLKTFPEAAEVLYNHFGASCFNCPAVSLEKVEIGVVVHQADADSLYRDLMKKISAVPPEKLD